MKGREEITISIVRNMNWGNSQERDPSWEYKAGAAASNRRESRKVAKNELPSIEEIMKLYGKELYHLCLLYLGNRELAEDAYQETMIKVWRELPHFRGESKLITWLRRIAVNTCKDTLRSGWFRFWKRSEPEEKLYQLASPQDEHGEVRSAIGKLPGMYREVVILYYYEEMKLREIAEALELSVNTVSSRLQRGRELLKKMLKEG